MWQRDTVSPNAAINGGLTMVMHVLRILKYVANINISNCG